MGLDMYLYRSQHANPEGKELLRVVRKGEVTTFEPEFPTLLREEIGYWRKANQIHGWFVDNVQDGVDDCREWDVAREDLARLYETTLEVIKASTLIAGKVSVGYTLEEGKRVDNFVDGQVIADATVAKRLLPTRQGFFFGKETYDMHYLEDLIRTKHILKQALDLPPEYDFSYRASW